MFEFLGPRPLLSDATMKLDLFVSAACLLHGLHPLEAVAYSQPPPSEESQPNGGGVRPLDWATMGLQSLNLGGLVWLIKREQRNAAGSTAKVGALDTKVGELASQVDRLTKKQAKQLGLLLKHRGEASLDKLEITERLNRLAEAFAARITLRVHDEELQRALDANKEAKTCMMW